MLTKKIDKNTLLKNWSYLLFADISSAIISFFVFMFLARKLNPEGFGTLNALLALASLFSVFAVNVGANQVITLEVTHNPKTTAGIFRIVFPLRMFSLVIAILVLVVYQGFLLEGNYGLIAAASLIVISTVLWDLAESIAFGHFVTKLTTLVSISTSLIWFILVVLLPSKNLSVNLVIWVYASLFLLRGIIYFFLSYSRFVKSNTEEPVVNIRTILLMSMPYLWMRVVGTFGEQVPILLLKEFSGSAEVGYFAVGNRFIMPITLAVTSGLRAVFPFMSKLFLDDKEKFQRNLVQGFTFILLTGATIAAILTITSGIWLPLFFGKLYLKSIAAFNYQAWFGVLLCFDLLLATVLSSTYRQKTLAIITTIDVLILFPLLYFGAPYGAEGMAIAKLIGALISIFYHILVVFYVLKINLKSISFFLSVLYFSILMTTSIFVPLISVKLLIILITIALFLVVKTSPLRELISILSTNIKKRFTNIGS